MLIERALPALGARRTYRLALAIALATAAAYSSNLPLAFLAIALTAVLVSAPVPPPGLKASVVLILLTCLTCGWGLLLGPVLTYVPIAGVLLMLLSVGAAAWLATDPRRVPLGSLVVLGSTMIAVVARQSSAAAVGLLQTLVVSVVVALLIGRFCHLLFPEDGAVQRPAAPPMPAGAAGWVAVRAGVIMLPPILLALINPANYVMLLMKGAGLSQQVERTHSETMARELVLSTLLGGATAVAIWAVLRLWPGLLPFTLLMGFAALLLARPMYQVIASRYRFEHWQNVLITAIIIIGPAVTDSGSGVDIEKAMLIRFLTFVALALYATFMVSILDGWRGRRRRILT